LYSGTATLSFYRLEMAPQFDAVLVDVVARFATPERCEKRVCQVFPGNPRQFLQPVHVAGEKA
jgi:hypothetical protein